MGQRVQDVPSMGHDPLLPEQGENISGSSIEYYKNHKSPEEWDELSSIIGIATHSLKARWITLINPKQKSQNWSEAEDEVIRDSMKQRLHKHIWT
jgi:Myb-like DNA-binding domain